MSTTTTTAAPSATPPPPRRSSWKAILAKLTFSIVLLVVLFELACQVFLWKMNRGWQLIRQDPGHYYQASTDPILAYELKSNYSYSTEGRSVHINRYGVRDSSEEVPAAPRRIMLLGDSVTFGVGFDQKETVSGMTQQLLDPSRKNVAVISVSVPGYGLREVLELLKEKNAIYHATDVIYLMNANDFSFRDTVYEGADNGLYRLYNRPTIASVFLVRKAIYRWHKSGSVPMKNEVLVSVPWYKWLFAGNRERGYDILKEIKQYADANHIRLAVLPLPAACAYQNGKYELDAMFDDIFAFLKQQDIASLDTRAMFAPHAKDWEEGTDHLTLEGNRAMSAFLASQLGAAPASAPAQ